MNEGGVVVYTYCVLCLPSWKKQYMVSKMAN